MRLRFFHRIREGTPEFSANLTNFDRERQMAFVAIDPLSGNLLGVVRIASSYPGDTCGEFAVLLRADMKGQGLGLSLMRHVLCYARNIGLQRVIGHVMAENSKMLNMTRRLGFVSSRVAGDLSTVRVELSLDSDAQHIKKS